jgi:MSHA biogenesis protein MshL
MTLARTAAVLLLSACAAPPPPAGVDPRILNELDRATTERKAAERPSAVDEALLPPLRMDMPNVAGTPLEPRFDLSVNSAPASQVFMSLVSGTRYSMLVHPSVSGTITINLKDVNLREALDSIRDLYGYEYKIDGTRILIQPAGIQTRVFQVNYLAAQRRGVSQLRVTSTPFSQTTTTGGVTTGVTPGLTGTAGTTGAGTTTGAASGFGTLGGPVIGDSARLTTNHEAIFWSDLCEALAALALTGGSLDSGAAATAATAAGAVPGATPGTTAAMEDRQRSICNRRGVGDRSMVVSPQSGVIVIRATPSELRAVENYLRATRLAVERQVMLEAKIIEVTLSEQYQSGINWAIFNRSGGVGQFSRPEVPPQLQGQLTQDQIRALARAQLLNGASGAVVGLAVATPNFAALMTFLETQGHVQVLSSPRVATLNNQKAVLKVGDEQLFVSNVSVTPISSATTGAVTNAVATPQFSPYFSGIVLDVTPQIDEGGNITLHVHPSINDVSNVQTNVDLGFGNVTLPTAKSTIRETDTIVRVADGSIVAIGGLMRTEVNDQRSGIPGAPDSGVTGLLFRNTSRVVQKKELVILLKPTIVDADRGWEQDARETEERMRKLYPAQPAAKR